MQSAQLIARKGCVSAAITSRNMHDERLSPRWLYAAVEQELLELPRFTEVLQLLGQSSEKEKKKEEGLMNKTPKLLNSIGTKIV